MLRARIFMVPAGMNSQTQGCHQIRPYFLLSVQLCLNGGKTLVSTFTKNPVSPFLTFCLNTHSFWYCLVPLLLIMVSQLKMIFLCYVHYFS